MCDQQAGDPRFHAVLTELGQLHAKKGADYGRGADVFANIRASEEWGVPAWQAAMIRANDKIHRLKSYCLNGKLANEGVEDSLLDLAAYAIIALVLFREQQQSETVQFDAPREEHDAILSLPPTRLRVADTPDAGGPF